MKTIKVFAVAGLISASAAVAAADLWKFDGLISATNEPLLGQVHTPGAEYCWDNAPEPGPPDYSSPCYTEAGGWWFGYGDKGGKAYDGVNESYDLTLPQALKINEYDGSLPGQKFIKQKGLGDATEGLHVKFKLASGTADVPSLAGIGFNWRAAGGSENDYEGLGVQDLSGKPGLCIKYYASACGVDVELGWNERAYGYDTWIYKLPECTSSSGCMANMTWDKFQLSYEDESQDLAFAKTNAEALKVVYKNKNDAAMTVEFKLMELGWAGTCSGTAVAGPSDCGGQVSIKVPSGKIAAQFNLSGRVLSIANISTPTHVQVINMQGALVAQKTLRPNESLNLANMPTGIYVVRSAKLGISQKIILK